MVRYVIDNYKWATDHTPFVEVVLSADEVGIVVGFQVFETERFYKPQYKKDGEPVYLDSAVEFFLQPFHCGKYLNFEFNSSGAGIMGVGFGKHDREELIHKYKNRLNLKVMTSDDKWKLMYKIPYDVIEEIYNQKFGYQNVKDGIKGNIFKCCERQDATHYGMLFDIKSPHPEFHLPEYFRDFFKDLE